VKALDKQPAKALKLADKAISIEPREGLFHGLRGDAYYNLKELEKARLAYDRAVSLNPDFFRPYLRRGLVRSQLGDESGARSDLQKSLQLLPTADAHYYLGKMAEDGGDRRSALAHFQIASGSESAAGKAAFRQMAAMEMSNNPGRYLETALGVDRWGNLLVQITNRTAVAVRDPVVLVGRRDASGSIYRGREHQLQGILQSGKSMRFKSGIRGLSSNDQLREFDARVIRAVPVQ
ncbi:MAG TPA: tetratricopeptide repeat protein, partial [Gammaproteobacteria bacterium]|nr:tetratricopeptide repeat protein [Gammaproteobacteria bacterium]